MIVSLRVPFKTQRIGKGKLIMLPQLESASQPQRKPDKTLVGALAKAWYCQKLLDEGKYCSIKALAKKLRLNYSNVTRLLQMNLLSPEIKRAILDGTQPSQLNMQMLKKPWPEVWVEQLKHCGFDR